LEIRKEFVIDGSNFSTMSGFYDEVERVLTSNLDWKIGRNLDAFNDVLKGGFGRHEYVEPIIIKLFKYQKSMRDLGVDAMKTRMLKSPACAHCLTRSN